MKNWKLLLGSSLGSLGVIAGAAGLSAPTAAAQTNKSGTPSWQGPYWICNCTMPSANCGCVC
jgi:hypothetical protein